MSFNRALAATAALVAAIAVGLHAATASPAAEVGVFTGRGGAGGPGFAGTVSQGGQAVAHSKSFAISGRVGGLYPGAVLPLPLTITNPWNFAIIVTSISAAIYAGGPACAAANLSVSTFSGHLVVDARGLAHTSLEVALAHSAPDTCQGAVFPLVYSGVARRAR